jgi:hypothetical protein
LDGGRREGAPRRGRVCHHPRVCRRVAPVVLVAALAALVLGFCAQHAPAAAAYKPCGLTESEQQPRGGKPTYVFTLRQQRTTCVVAKRVAKAFHACRATADYRCTKRLLAHWRCTGRKDSSTAQLLYANFTCTWGPRRVTSKYQQNT